eukprot:7469555-Ditylum_brightwellii.AAC.1
MLGAQGLVLLFEAMRQAKRLAAEENLEQEWTVYLKEEVVAAFVGNINPLSTILLLSNVDWKEGIENNKDFRLVKIALVQSTPPYPRLNWRTNNASSSGRGEH